MRSDQPSERHDAEETIFAANDWHGLVPRASRFVAAYFGRWALLRKGLPWQPLLEPEEWGWRRESKFKFRCVKGVGISPRMVNGLR